MRRPRLGRTLLALAALYALVMVVRFVVSGALHPERRRRLSDFMAEAAADFVEHEVNLIYGTVCLIRRDWLAHHERLLADG